MPYEEVRNTMILRRCRGMFELINWIVACKGNNPEYKNLLLKRCISKGFQTLGFVSFMIKLNTSELRMYVSVENLIQIHDFTNVICGLVIKLYLKDN